MSNEEKTNDYENFEKEMIYMKILKKGGVVEKRGEEEAKSMPHAPVHQCRREAKYIVIDCSEGFNICKQKLNIVIRFISDPY